MCMNVLGGFLYGIRSSYSCSNVYHIACFIFQIFAGDSADHAIDRELLHVIWSFGQVFPDYSHSPGSGIEAGTASNNMYYQPDEIKYHGALNRGVTSINFHGM